MIESGHDFYLYVIVLLGVYFVIAWKEFNDQNNEESSSRHCCRSEDCDD